jgi:hypothetical protein
MSGSAPDYVSYASNGLFSDSGEGLIVEDCRQWRLRDAEIHHMQGACVDFIGPSNWRDVGVINGCYFHDSHLGLRTSGSGEGLAVSDTFISDCEIAVQIDSGNNTLTNCHIAKSAIGIKISGGTNNAHGAITGCIVRHCTYPLVCVDVTLGETFLNCLFTAGQGGADQGVMQIVNSKGIVLSGGQVAYCNVTVDATSQLALRGVTFRGPVNFTVTAGGVLDAKDTVVMAGATVTLNGAPWNGNN